MDKIVTNMNERFVWIWDHDLLADIDKATEEFKALTKDDVQVHGDCKLHSVADASVEDVVLVT